MLKKNHILFLFIFLTYYVSYGQDKNFLNPERNIPKDSIAFVQIKTDTLFNSKQTINLLILQKDFFDRFHIMISYSKSDLKTTSAFAKEGNALDAINGSFFDMDSGGSVTYLEVNDTVISRTRPSNLKWAKPDSLINGAIVITNDFNINIEPAKSDEFYEQSKQERAVMVSGPLLMFNSEIMKLPNMDFANDRYPRTCICMTKDYLIFIAIDGRRKDAEGMSLIELQKFLLNIGCVDAINLDGGGSTTMWIKDKGVVNIPSDKTGERSVSNAILIINK